MKKLKSLIDLELLKHEIISRKSADRSCISISSCDHTHRSEETADAFARELREKGLQDEVDIRRTGCHGFCAQGPIVVISPQQICYLKVDVEHVPDIVAQTLIRNKAIDGLLYTDEATGRRITYEDEIPFYSRQHRVLLKNNELIDPLKIEDYIALGGYSALAEAISEMDRQEVLDIIKDSNLRGRGGGGFPTGIKWESSMKAPGKRKYVVVNADEGDPGAYMDRGLLEGNPHIVLEGLIIGAYTVGASEGFVYVRQEYPLAVENITHAIQQARKYGLLGNDILGSGFDFDVHVHRGAGAFVSGESSALMNAVEGKLGEPRSKYIHTAVSGIKGKPTVLNNVETWANVPLIVKNGAEWFKGIGTEGSSGTKIFSLVGKVKNTGLVEVPMGTTLREIVFGIGGGIPENKKFKAVQTGGPSGGCLPEKLLDLPVDFDELTKAGSMMGSGGMIVMDEDTCMVDLARYFVKFLSEESCGKCVPCREGLRQMLFILERICRGEGEMADIGLLEELAEMMSSAAMCALGTSAPNPVMSTIRYFRDEYEAHIVDKKCPARVCSELISYTIDEKKCQACMICARNCPTDAITGAKGIVHFIDQSKCIRCGMCEEVCPDKFKAVVKVSGRLAPTAPPASPVAVAKKRGS